MRAIRQSTVGVLLVTSFLLLGAPLWGGVTQSQADESVDYSASYLVAITGTTGLFGFAGHKHAVLASGWSADIKLNFNDLAHSSVAITVPAAKLVIDSPAARQKAGMGEGPGEAEVSTIQKRMLSSEVLDAAHYPQIKFTATDLKAQDAGQMQVVGNMQIHGRQHPLSIPVRYHSTGRQTECDGEFSIRQTDYGLKPESVAGGTVKVKDSITIKFHIVITAAR